MSCPVRLFRSSALVLAALNGCTCARSQPTALDDASVTAADASAASTADAAASAAAGDDGGPRFSLPIAAARDAAKKRTFVAGLRVPERAITLSVYDDAAAARNDGVAAATTWSTDAITAVTWSQDAELHVWAADGGAWVVWRGLVDGKPSQKARWVEGPDARSEVFDVKGASCGLGRTLFHVGGGALVSRAPDGGAQRAKLPDPGADISILCGEQRPLLLSESDDGAALLAPADGGLEQLGTFGGDSDGRTTLMFAGGGRAGVVRVADKDAIVREIAAGKLGPTKKVRLGLAEDDDIVAVDTLASGPVLVTTHEIETTCDGGSGAAPRVEARVLLGDADAAATGPLELGAPSCGRERGPFWSGLAGTDLVVAWAERVRNKAKTTAPIAGVSFARLRADGSLGDHGFIDVAADGMVDAGCDERACYAVALVRKEGDDDSKPESVRVLTLASAK